MPKLTTLFWFGSYKEDLATKIPRYFYWTEIIVDHMNKIMNNPAEHRENVVTIRSPTYAIVSECQSWKSPCSMAPRWVKRQVTFVEPGMRWDRIRMRPSQARHWKMQIKHFPKVLSKWNYNLNWHTQHRWAAPQGERLAWCHDGLDPAYTISGFPFSRMIASWRDSIIALNILGVSKTSFIGTSSPGSFWSMVNRNSKILSYEMSDGRTKMDETQEYRDKIAGKRRPGSES